MIKRVLGWILTGLGALALLAVAAASLIAGRYEGLVAIAPVLVLWTLVVWLRRTHRR